MFDDLTPLRRAYGVEAPAERQPASGADGSTTEEAILRQSRAALEATVAAQDRTPSAAAVEAVCAEAARASAEALAPLAAVRALYNEPTATAPNPAEAALLAQTRAAVEQTLDARPQSPSADSAAAVLAFAATQTCLAPRPDAAVEAPALAPLAVAYGLPLGAGVVPDPAETALLVQTRALLDDAPATAGPSEAVLSAVLAHAASAGPEAPLPADRPAADRPATAPDREPVRAARSYRRAGAWASAAMAMAAVVFVLFPRTAGAPERAAMDLPPTSIAAAIPAAPDAEDDIAEARPADPQPEPASFDLAAPVTAPTAAPSAPTPSGPSPSEPVAASQAPAPAAPRPVARPTPPAEAPRTAAPRPAPSARSVASAPETTTALASADVTPANDDAWDVQDDVRVLSLRLQELRRGNEGLAWDTPTEAFGAPTTRSAFSSPGIRSVRTTVPAARARLVTEPVTGDR